MKVKLLTNTNFIFLFKQLWLKLSQKRKKDFWIIISFSVLCSIIEVLSIGSVVPFLLILTDPSSLLSKYSFLSNLAFLNSIDTSFLIIFFTVIFVFLISLSAFLRLILIWIYNKFSFNVGLDIGKMIFNNFINQNYSFFIDRNSSEIISIISNKINIVIYYIVLPSITIVSSLVILLIISLIPLIIFTKFSLIIIFVFTIIYIGIAKLFKKLLLSNSYTVSNETTRVIKILKESVGNIRDILINRKQKIFLEEFLNTDFKLRKAQAISNFINSSPRYIVESIAVFMLMIIAFQNGLLDNNGLDVITFIGILAFFIQKTLPLMQQSFASYSHIKSSIGSLEDILEYMNLKFEKDIKSKKKFTKIIKLSNVSFRYEESGKNIFDNINLTIHRGDKIGIIGRTGSGKSTLVDLISGLLMPTKGFMFIDNKKLNSRSIRILRDNIRIVSQNIFLSDISIIENIALGQKKEEIDILKVINVLKIADAYDFVINLKNGLESRVGDNGINLSGGQIQRLGIARALFNDFEILILDECTSSLDSQTEKRVINNIYKKFNDKTIISISHKKNSLRFCNRLFIVKNKELIMESG